MRQPKFIDMGYIYFLCVDSATVWMPASEKGEGTMGMGEGSPSIYTGTFSSCRWRAVYRVYAKYLSLNHAHMY